VSASPIAIGTQTTFTTTGTINDLDFGNAELVRMNNATLATITGLLAAGRHGQLVTFISVGAGAVFFSPQSASSVAANRLINVVTVGPTPLAAGNGTATYRYDSISARWRLMEHVQGGSITPTFDATDFTGDTSMVWTVDSGDYSGGTWAYVVNGKTLLIAFNLSTTSVSGVPSITLQARLPNGYVANVTQFSWATYVDSGVQVPSGLVASVATLNFLLMRHIPATTVWVASTNNTTVQGQILFEIQ
jgi:hypothetical protein